MTRRTYTVNEANAALAEIRPRLQRMRAARQRILQGAQVVRGRVEADGGGHHPDRGYAEASSVLRSEMEVLAEIDVALRDAETGVVDFPAERDGRPVFLCWRLGEDEVGFWHETDSGFGSRRPL